MADDSLPKRTRIDTTDEGAEEDDANVDGYEVTAEAEADAVLEQELRNAQAELDKENEEMLEQMHQVERQFNARKSPLYRARGEVIKQIPGFWLHCFMQHEEIKLVLGAVDQEILSKITELRVEPFDDVKSGYQLVLHFAENDFFEDDALIKEIKFQHEPGQPLQCSVTGCDPKWKGQDLIQAETVKGGRKRGRDSAAFLRWFTQANTFPPGLIDTLADIIKDQLWVNPLEFMDAEEDAEEPIILEGDEDPEGEEVWDLEEGDEEGDEEGEEQPQEAGEEAELEEYEEYQEEEGKEGTGAAEGLGQSLQPATEDEGEGLPWEDVPPADDQ